MKVFTRALTAAAWAVLSITTVQAEQAAEPEEAVAITMPKPAMALSMPIAKSRKQCVRETGTRLISREPDGCLTGNAGTAITGSKLQRTNWQSISSGAH